MMKMSFVEKVRTELKHIKSDPAFTKVKGRTPIDFVKYWTRTIAVFRFVFLTLLFVSEHTHYYLHVLFSDSFHLEFLKKPFKIKNGYTS